LPIQVHAKVCVVDCGGAGLDAIAVTIWLLILTLVVVLRYGEQLFA
jgi:hypothetical protein